MSTTSAAQSARNRYAISARHLGHDHPKTLEAKRDLAAANLEKHISRIVSEAPPFDEATRSRLAALLDGPRGVQS